ncbi:hypothetical protein [Mesorhizobium sp. CAU 1741]|uniref:hypothetical protein n=1 Tax=Mesorhizobium sp. CAU 1741 TaxID=3140366 RepID=UPI00325C1BBD
MNKILITCLTAHWAIVYGLWATQAAGLADAGDMGTSIGAGFDAAAHALVGVLFLWAGVTVWGRGGGDVAEVTALAFAAAAVVLAATTALNAGAEPATLGDTAFQLAALGVTYLVVRDEDARSREEQPERDYSNEVARRLATGAAHGSMLTRLSRRGPHTLETDA